MADKQHVGNSSYPSNLAIFADFGIFYFTGQQLYSGSEDNPVFIDGTYDLTNFDGTDYTLSITSATAVTPEPSTLTLLSLGLVLLLGPVGRKACSYFFIGKKLRQVRHHRRHQNVVQGLSRRSRVGRGIE